MVSHFRTFLCLPGVLLSRRPLPRNDTKKSAPKMVTLTLDCRKVYRLECFRSMPYVSDFSLHVCITVLIATIREKALFFVAHTLITEDQKSYL